MDVDPGTQESGETSKAKLFTPDAPSKCAVLEWRQKGNFLVQRIFVDVALNIQVPVAGYFLEKYFETAIELLLFFLGVIFFPVQKIQVH